MLNVRDPLVVGKPSYLADHSPLHHIILTLNFRHFVTPLLTDLDDSTFLTLHYSVSLLFSVISSMMRCQCGPSPMNTYKQMIEHLCNG